MSKIEALKEEMQKLFSQGKFAEAHAVGKQIEKENENNSTEPPIETVIAVPSAEDQSDSTVDEPPPPQPPLTQPPAALQTPAPIAPDPMEEIPDEEHSVQQDVAPVDETEQMFQEYNTRRSAAEQELSDFEAGQAARESQRGVMTGVAGALSAFGEGLATITGGSAKPLQAGVAAVKSMGEQQADGESRKAKSLRERILQSRQPLEQKADEIKFRDVFEERQAKKDLVDPASVKSQQARVLANSFLDTYIASVSNRTSERDLAKLEGVRPKLENMSAAQIKDFMDNLNKLKFTESREDIENAKSNQSSNKVQEAQSFNVQLRAQKAITDVNSQLQQDKKFYDQYKVFKTNLQKAIKGDKPAQQYIKNNMDSFSYLKSRTLESKGVFTDQDAARLTTLLKDQTWAGQFQTWVSGGLQGEIPIDTLRKLSEALRDEPINPAVIKKQKLQAYATTARQSSNAAIRGSADFYDKTANQQNEQTEQTEQNTVPTGPDAPEFPNIEAAKAARRAGQIKVGNSFKITGDSTLYKVK